MTQPSTKTRTRNSSKAELQKIFHNTLIVNGLDTEPEMFVTLVGIAVCNRRVKYEGQVVGGRETFSFISRDIPDIGALIKMSKAHTNAIFLLKYQQETVRGELIFRKGFLLEQIIQSEIEFYHYRLSPAMAETTLSGLEVSDSIYEHTEHPGADI